MEETLVVVGLLYSLLLNHLLVVQNFELLRVVDLIPVAVASAAPDCYCNRTIAPRR